MEQVAQGLGVNRSTVQRMERRGIEPSKTYKLNSIAEVLDTTVEWLTGQSEEKEISFGTRSKKKIDRQIDIFLADTLNNIDDTQLQDLMVMILTRFIDMFGVIAVHFGNTMREVREVEPLLVHKDVEYIHNAHNLHVEVACSEQPFLLLCHLLQECSAYGSRAAEHHIECLLLHN